VRSHSVPCPEQSRRAASWARHRRGAKTLNPSYGDLWSGLRDSNPRPAAWEAATHCPRLSWRVVWWPEITKISGRTHATAGDSKCQSSPLSGGHRRGHEESEATNEKRASRRGHLFAQAAIGTRAMARALLSPGLGQAHRRSAGSAGAAIGRGPARMGDQEGALARDAADGDRFGRTACDAEDHRGCDHRIRRAGEAHAPRTHPQDVRPGYRAFSTLGQQARNRACGRTWRAAARGV
jgi:hypothetical protein